MEKKYFWDNKTILVVEDEEYSFQLIEEILKEKKVKVLHARDGEEAVVICKDNNAIDLILMDIQLPHMNGYEATREIKKHNKNIPVIAQTAFAMAGDREKSINAGCNDYITKPIKIDELLNKVDYFFNFKK